jgi:spore germination protein GerM
MLKKISIILVIILVIAIGYFIFQKEEAVAPISEEEKEEKAEEELVVKVFFGNSKLNAEALCDKVFSVERIVSGKEIIKLVLEELLKGPTGEEQEIGYFTNINEGIKIQNIEIIDETVVVDFDEQLEFQVGGSCRVIAIRAEIEETLKQFSGVEEVVISINGRTEDILQP